MSDSRRPATGAAPRYSVVIPTFDRSGLLSEAIDSVLAQDCPAFEIVVVDDGSRDDTAAVVRAYGAPVRYRYQANQGPSAARNLGVSACRGDFVAFLDSDDVWHHHKIRHDLETFAAHPDADVVAGDVDCHLRGRIQFPSLMDAVGIPFPGARPRTFGGDLLRIARGPLLSTSSMVFRRRALARLGPDVFDPALRYDEDWDLEFRLYANYTVVFTPEVVGTYRQFDDSTRPYGLPDAPRSPSQREELRHLRLTILRRYCRWDVWPAGLRRELQQQEAELVALAGAPPPGRG